MDRVQEILDILRENNALLKELLSKANISNIRDREIEEIIRSQNYSVGVEFLINMSANIISDVLITTMMNQIKDPKLWADIIVILKENLKDTSSKG